MKTTFFTIASGSSGNCTFIGSDGQGILIDAGVAMRTVNAALDAAGLEMTCLTGIFITHEHDDHIKNLRVIANKYRIPVFCNQATASAITLRLPQLDPDLIRVVETGKRVRGNTFEVASFATSHDAAEPVGYTVTTGNAVISVLTDSGCITQEMVERIRDSRLVLLESNYDQEMLLSGMYPPYLKRRIMSKKGHLSNDDCARTVLSLVQSGVRHIVMGHLSKENNCPTRAYETTSCYLRENGIPEAEFTLLTAPRERPCEIHIL